MFALCITAFPASVPLATAFVAFESLYDAEVRSLLKGRDKEHSYMAQRLV